MANDQDIQTESMNSGPSEDEMQAVEQVITSLQLARKNYSLYPEDHVNCHRALERFWLQLDKYLRVHGDLRLELAKNKLLFQGEVILSEPPEEGNLPFTLFRDGIQWLEFQGGITSSEVEQFLRILNKYRILSDEPEGDLVTALWEARFPHIKYNVADFFWGSEPDVEFTTSTKAGDADSARLEEEGEKVSKSTGRADADSALSEQDEEKVSKSTGAADADSAPLEEDEEKVSKSECFPPIEPAELKMTPEEEASLHEMVRFEEKRNPTTDYLNILLDTLLENREKENLVAILESLEEEFHDSLARKDFNITVKILKSLHQIHKTCAADTTWALPIIDNFFLTASSSKSLRPLQVAWTDMDTEQIIKIKQILVLLQPEAIHTLGDILLETSSLRLQKMLMEVILSLASRDLQPLETMLDRPEEELVQKLVYVIGRLDGERTTQILGQMIRHSSARVRHEAAKALLSRGTASMEKLFHLIEDENETIRRLILKHMAQDKDKVTEALLLKYLEQDKLKRFDDEHVIACFRTLGRCGSTRSIPFLRKTLLGRGWLPGFGKSAYRQGAALALQAMRLQEAQEILEGASRSLYPNVRRIARRAIRSQKQSIKG